MALRCVDLLKFHTAPQIVMNEHSNSAPLRVAGALRVLRNLLGVSLLAVLLPLAPIVESLCGTLFLLGLLMAITFKISGAANFPFWSVIALSLGFGIFVIFYHAVLGILLR
jgi:hypothetical protein